MTVSDDEVVLLYLEIADLLQQLPITHCLQLLKTVERMFDSESDTDLGDFLNNIFLLYAYTSTQEWDELHYQIRELLYNSELDYDVVFHVGTSILEETYIHHYLPTCSEVH